MFMAQLATGQDPCGAYQLVAAAASLGAFGDVGPCLGNVPEAAAAAANPAAAAAAPPQGQAVPGAAVPAAATPVEEVAAAAAAAAAAPDLASLLKCLVRGGIIDRPALLALAQQLVTLAGKSDSVPPAVLQQVLLQMLANRLHQQPPSGAATAPAAGAAGAGSALKLQPAAFLAGTTSTHPPASAGWPEPGRQTHMAASAGLGARAAGFAGELSTQAGLPTQQQQQQPRCNGAGSDLMQTLDQQLGMAAKARAMFLGPATAASAYPASQPRCRSPEDLGLQLLQQQEQRGLGKRRNMETGDTLLQPGERAEKHTRLDDGSNIHLQQQQQQLSQQLVQQQTMRAAVAAPVGVARSAAGSHPATPSAATAPSAPSSPHAVSSPGSRGSAIGLPVGPSNLGNCDAASQFPTQQQQYDGFLVATAAAADAVSGGLADSVKILQSSGGSDMGLLESKITSAFLEAVGSATQQQQQHLSKSSKLPAGSCQTHQLQQGESAARAPYRTARLQQGTQQQQQQALPHPLLQGSVMNVLSLVNSLQQQQGPQQQQAGEQQQQSFGIPPLQGTLLKHLQQEAEARLQQSARLQRMSATGSDDAGCCSVRAPACAIAGSFTLCPPFTLRPEQRTTSFGPPVSGPEDLALQQRALATNALLARLLQQQQAVQQQLRDVLNQQQQQHVSLLQEEQLPAASIRGLASLQTQPQPQGGQGDAAAAGGFPLEIVEMELDMMQAGGGSNDELDMYDFMGKLLDETDTGIPAGGAGAGPVAAPFSSSGAGVAAAGNTGAGTSLQPAAAALGGFQIYRQDNDMHPLSKVCLEALLTPSGPQMKDVTICTAGS